MEKFYSDMTAIVVGSSRQNLIRETIVFLDQIDIAFELCEDIYSAAAAIAAAPAGQNLLVVGCFTALTVENMRLFSLVPRDKKVFFCGIIKKWFDHLQPKAIAAVQAGVFVINNVEQLENIIAQHRCATTAAMPLKVAGKSFSSRIASLADTFFLTQAEHDALLGANHNANTENRTFTE
jgi:hypothetical protein